jgi:hypothetical protein
LRSAFFEAVRSALHLRGHESASRSAKEAVCPQTNLAAGPGVAIREDLLKTGEAGYLLFTGGKALGTVRTGEQIRTNSLRICSFSTAGERVSQVVIEDPITNSPFDEPTRRFKFTDGGITDEEVAGRSTSFKKLTETNAI